MIMLRRQISTSALRRINKILKEENLKMCSETGLILHIDHFGTRVMRGQEVPQSYSKIARKGVTA